MTTPRIPKIKYPQKGEVGGFITINRMVRKLGLSLRADIKECFPSKEEMTDEMFQDNISFLQGKIINTTLEEVIELEQYDGKKLINKVKGLKSNKGKRHG